MSPSKSHYLESVVYGNLMSEKEVTDVNSPSMRRNAI